jgi:hypothetical protein
MIWWIILVPVSVSIVLLIVLIRLEHIPVELLERQDEERRKCRPDICLKEEKESLEYLISYLRKEE